MGKECLPGTLTELTIPFVGSERTANGTSDAIIWYLFAPSKLTPVGYEYYYGDDDEEYTEEYPISDDRVYDSEIICYDEYEEEYERTASYYDCPNLKEITITDAKIIPKYAFCNMTQLEHIHLNSGITLLDNDSFRGCIALQTPSIPKNIKTIGDRVFSGCEFFPGCSTSSQLSVSDPSLEGPVCSPGRAFRKWRPRKKQARGSSVKGKACEGWKKGG